MTKSQLIAGIARRHPLIDAKDAGIAVKTMLDVMAVHLTEGQRIEIRGFGSFDLNYRPSRIGRNPKTGKTVDVPGKYAPHFKSAKELRERIAGK